MRSDPYVPVGSRRTSVQASPFHGREVLKCVPLVSQNILRGLVITHSFVSFASLIHPPHSSFVLPRATLVLLSGSACGRIQTKMASVMLCETLIYKLQSVKFLLMTEMWALTLPSTADPVTPPFFPH